MPAQTNEIYTSEIHELEVEEQTTGTLPLYKAKYWSASLSSSARLALW